MSFLAPPVSPSSTPHQETEGVTHSCLSQVTVPWAEQDGRWKLYYDTNSYKMHTYRQDIFNSHPYQNNFKRYFLESKATNQIHHNLIMHKQTAQHSSGSRSPPPHFHVSLSFGLSLWSPLLSCLSAHCSPSTFLTYFLVSLSFSPPGYHH